MRCLDHRGKLVWVSLELDPDRKGAVRDVALRRHRAMYAVMVLGISTVALLVALLAVGGVAGTLLPNAPPLVLGILVYGGGGILGGTALVYLQRRLFLRRFARRLHRAGLCICCAYDLKGVPVEPDGCRVCPECGAAWKLPDGR